MLSKTFPQIKDVNMESFVDFANLNSIVEDKEDSDIPKPRGGLTGVVETFLNRSLNKKQQLSNWEQRPLTDEQTKYAGMFESFIKDCLLSSEFLTTALLCPYSG